MHYFLKFIFGIELYMLQTGFLFIISSLAPYKQQYVYVIQVLLTASSIRTELHSVLIPLTSSQQNLS